MNESESILAAIYRAVDWINGELPPDRQLVKAPELDSWARNRFSIHCTL
jgi:hypothetical protein